MRVQCRGLRAREYGVVREIIAGAFGDHVRDNPAALEQLEGEPWYDPDHLLVAEADGEVVSHLGVRDSGLWLGGRWFAAGLVGTVCTREELRGQGIGSELLRHAFGWMAQRGLALSLLHTNEQRYAFYERLGYRRAVIEQPRLMADLGRAGAAREAGVRAASAADAAALDEIYAATYGRATGAWARSGPFWERRIAGIPKLWSRVVRFAVAGHGSPRAYAAYEEAPGAGIVHELACAPEAEGEAVALVEHLLARWREGGVLVAELALSSGHPLRGSVDHLVAEDHTGRDVVFVRVQDGARFMEAVRPLLQQRAAQARVELEVNRDGEGVALDVGGDGRGPLALSLTELAVLVYSGRMAASQEELAARLRGRGWTGGVLPETGAARCGLDAY